MSRVGAAVQTRRGQGGLTLTLIFSEGAESPPPLPDLLFDPLQRCEPDNVHYSKGLGLICLISSYSTPPPPPLRPPEWQMPISSAKVGVSIDQQANTGGPIHHLVFDGREGDPNVLPMRGGPFLVDPVPPRLVRPPDECAAMLTTATSSV